MVDKLKTFADRLKFLRKQSGLSLAAVAKQVGVSAQAVHKWETGGKVDDAREINLAHMFNVNPGWLIYGFEDEFEAEGGNHFPRRIYENLPERFQEGPSVPVPAEEGVFVPLLSHDAVTNWISRTGAWDFHRGEWIACPGPHGDSTYALKVADSSMEDLGARISYSEGDIIFVDPAITPWSNSRVVLTSRPMGEHSPVIFRQLIIEGWEMFRQPLSKNWPEQKIRIPEHEQPAGTVIGKWVKE